MIAEGDHEIARLRKLLADVSGAERETASGAERQTSVVAEGGGAAERRADFVIPFRAGDYPVRRRAA